MLFTGENKIDGIVNTKVPNSHWANAKLYIEEKRIQTICKECGIAFQKAKTPIYATLNEGKLSWVQLG